jgi:hypothetical protein
MASCEKFETLLCTSGSKELGSRQLRMLERHLEECQPCEITQKQLSQLVGMARSALTSDEGMSAATRIRIARDAAARASRRQGWGFPFGLPVALQTRPALLLAAAAGVAVLLAMPLALRRGATSGTAAEVAVKIDVAARADGAVRLAWSDGTKVSYTVYRSTDPRHPGAGEPHKVNGNVWIDRAAGSAQVVYYRIE